MRLIEWIRFKRDINFMASELPSLIAEAKRELAASEALEKSILSVVPADAPVNLFPGVGERFAQARHNSRNLEHKIYELENRRAKRTTSYLCAIAESLDVPIPAAWVDEKRTQLTISAIHQLRATIRKEQKERFETFTIETGFVFWVRRICLWRPCAHSKFSRKKVAIGSDPPPF